MTAGLIIIAFVALVGVLLHRRTRFQERVFAHVPINDWLTLVVFPPCLFIGLALIIKNIISRASIGLIPIDDFDFIALMMMFVMYAFVGDSIHFVSKIMWRYLPMSDRHKMVFRVNEMFHGKFSHYLVYVSLILLIFVLVVSEINHPLPIAMASSSIVLIILGGIVFGLSGAKSVFYTNQWYGGYNKPLSFLMLIGVLILISIFRTLGISLSYYPVGLFIISTDIAFLGSFLMRQILIFTRLSERHRLRFLQRIFSA